MDGKINWVAWIISLFKEFIQESEGKPLYEILDIYECPTMKFMKAQIKLSGRHIIERSISDIVTDISFLEGFDAKAVRTLTYIATIEGMKPNYLIVAQQLGNEADDYILEIKSKNGKEVTKKSPMEVSKDKLLLSKFSPV